MMIRSGIGKTAALMLLAAACNAAPLQPDGSNTSAQPDAGPAPTGYFACRGGVESKVVIIANCDVDRRLVFVVPLVHAPGAPATPGVTLPADWRLSAATVADNMGSCPSRMQSELQARVTGTIEWARPGADASIFPSAVNVDVTLSFEPGDAAVPASESIVAQNLVVDSNCPP